MVSPISWLDIVILLPILYGLVRGAFRGVISELIAIAAVIFGVVGVRMFGLDLSNWIFAHSDWAEVPCQIVSTLCIFLVITIGLLLLGSLLNKFVRAIRLNWINRLAGAIVGALKWTIVDVIIAFILNFHDGQFTLLPSELKNASPVYTGILEWAIQVWNHIYPTITVINE